MSVDGQAIALVCSPLALGGQRSPKPLTLREWQHLRTALARSSWGRPGELLGRNADELRQELGVPEDLAERLARLLTRGGQLALELDRLAGRGIWVLTRADEGYPQLLKELLGAQAPPLLYGAGPESAFDTPALAVIGSRQADPDALAFARELGRRCSREHVTVVSGAARGIDREAMAGAVEAGGVAIGVTVDPLERLVRQPELRAAISEELMTLVTPYVPSARWQASNAMRRNRLIYTLSRAAVVAATAAGRGGTWTGAIENIKHGWVPIYVRSDAVDGSRELAAAGATPLPRVAVEDLDVQDLFTARPVEPPGERTLPTVGCHKHRGLNGESASAPLPPMKAVGASEGSDRDPARDAFWLVWVQLRDYLQEPRSEREVAEELLLQPVQARVWLARAVEEGMVELKRRPRKTYVIRRDDSRQLTLG